MFKIRVHSLFILMLFIFNSKMIFAKDTSAEIKTLSKWRAEFKLARIIEKDLENPSSKDITPEDKKRFFQFMKKYGRKVNYMSPGYQGAPTSEVLHALKKEKEISALLLDDIFKAHKKTSARFTVKFDRDVYIPIFKNIIQHTKKPKEKKIIISYQSKIVKIIETQIESCKSRIEVGYMFSRKDGDQRKKEYQPIIDNLEKFKLVVKKVKVKKEVKK